MAKGCSEPPEGLTVEGSRFFPMSAAISLFGTTSVVLTNVLAPGSLQVLGSFEGSVSLCFLLFFLAALVVGCAGGLMLALRWESSACKVSIRGRAVPERALRSCFLLCYSAPWLATAVAYFCTRRTL